MIMAELDILSQVVPSHLKFVRDYSRVNRILLNKFRSVFESDVVDVT